MNDDGIAHHGKEVQEGLLPCSEQVHIDRVQPTLRRTAACEEQGINVGDAADGIEDCGPEYYHATDVEVVYRYEVEPPLDQYIWEALLDRLEQG